MRTGRGLIAAVMVGVFALGCSDNGDGGTAGNGGGSQEFATTTLNLADASDTPFCVSFVDALQTFGDGMNNEAADGPDERASALLDEFKSRFQAATEIAPAEIQADMTTVNAAVQSTSDWPDLLVLSDDELAVLGRVNAYVNANCNLDLETAPQSLFS